MEASAICVCVLVHCSGAYHVLAGFSFLLYGVSTENHLVFAGRFSNFACAGFLRGLAAV